MRSLILAAFGVALATLLSAQASSTFFSTFDAERGSVLAPARDGRIWLGGMKDERALLTKLAFNGKVLEKHSIGFDGAGLDFEHLVDIFEDGDGMLVGCGNFENDNLGRGFVFRYDPATRKMVWSQIVRSNLNFIYGITELGPGGDFVLYANPHTIAGNDAELLQLHRATGQIVSGKAKRYGLGSSDNITQAVYHKGALYTCGRFTIDNGFNADPSRMRNGICRVDTATLEPLWTRIGPYPTGASARLSGRDIIIDNEAIISTLSGDATGPDLFSSTIFLQKNDLNGNLLWARQYDLPEWNGEFAEEVISVPDGYLLYGHDLLSDTSRLFLLKTDKSGFPLMAVKVDFDLNEKFPEIPARSKIIRLGDALYFTAMSQNNVGQTQGILAKTDLDGWVNDSCGFFQKTPVNLVAMPAPVGEAVIPPVTASPATVEGATVTVNLPDLTFSVKCGAGGTCPTLPDLRVTLDSFTCVDGYSVLHYSFCNLGGQAYQGSAFFGLYDKNPFTDTAMLITAVIHPGLSLQPGDCDKGSIVSSLFPPVIFELDTFSKLYAMIGIHLNMPIPVKISDFPFTPNKPECSYTNNLDSITVPENICGTCENPTTFVKKLGDPQRRELAYSMCKSSDGNIYLAGKQGMDLMIAKITLLGEPIWVRNFPDNPNFQIELSEILEDSEGKLVICGTQGTSPSNRLTLAMRYDPSADVVLWYKSYPAHRAVASGILEKMAGGNFILSSNSQEFVGGMLKTRSELLELDRISGDVVPTLAVRYLGEPNIRFESMAMSNGSLYAAGSRQTGPQQSLTPVFAKISADTGQPEWVYMTNPDTTITMPTVTSPGSMLIDNDFAIIAGIDDIAPAGSGNNNFLYLEKRHLDGTLIWMKRYDIQIFPEDVIRVANSYVIFGSFFSTNQWGMIKVDVANGNIILAKTLTAGATSSNFTFTPNRQSLALHIGVDILLGDHTQDGNGGGDLLLIRTDANFGLDDSCSLLQNIQVSFKDLPAKSQPLSIETVPALTTAFTSSTLFQPDSLNVSKLCPQCLFEDCADVTFEVGSIFCSADSALFYKANICNTGKQPYSEPFEVTFYDKNPLTEAAQAVWSIVVNEPLGPGKCKELNWPLPGTASQYTKLYTLAGVGSNTVTPVDLDSFPFPEGFTECRYGNNLDSFAVQTPVCDGCENPTTFFKTMGRVDRPEQGYSLCTASDGNVYMAGRQGNNPMIAKMTPNGEMLWVRNFPAGDLPFETVELVEIIEDSEGNIVICGTQGHSPNIRVAVAMRYDPVANQVLWFKNYPELNPEVLGIIEKTPGGNFVLYSFSDELFPGGPPLGSYYKARSEVWEIDRSTGEVVPALATLFAGNPSIYFQDMIPYNGSLYCVGGWRNPDIDNSGRTMLAKLSATDGTPEWIQGTLPDTAVAFRFLNFHNILTDSGQLVVLGSGITDLGQPTQKNYVFLSKFTLDGALLWMKSYEIALAGEDIVALPDGYAIFGRVEGNSWCLLKTDKDGNLLVAKKLTIPVAAGNTFLYYRQNQLLRLPNHLLVVDDYKDAVYTDIVLFKTDYDLNLDDSCSLFQTLQINTQVWPVVANPIFTPYEPYAVNAVNVTTTFQTDSLSIKQLCPQCPCLDKPDITWQVDSVYCSGADGVVANVRICNLGQVSPTAGFNLTFYDKNPLTGAATPLYSTFVPDKPGFGDCIQYSFTLDTALMKYPKLYTLAGVWGDVQTPVSPDDFPYPNGFAECDYANNLDSFEIQLPAPQTPQLGPDRSICAGETTTLDAGAGYVSYQWLNGPATRTFAVGTTGDYAVEVTDACGRMLRDTIQVTVAPQPEPVTITVLFYPGDTILVDGVPYTQSDTVVQTLLSAAGCDSVVTTILQLVVTGISLHCPANLTLTLPPNQTEMPVAYDLPTATTTCADPNLVINLSQGIMSGGLFPLGTTPVCYEAVNQCGIRDTCCFTVTVEAPDLPEDPCDVKTPAGCFRYELLGIQFDSLGQRRYRLRITNTCASPLLYTSIQLPKGVLAVSPKEGATYAAPGGNTYTVRNPNFSPFYSIRYKPVLGSLNNGASDIFEYTLPQQSAPDYIHVFAKLIDGTQSETHLNTFNCPVQPYGTAQNASPAIPRSPQEPLISAPLAVRPNPTDRQLFVDLRQWAGQLVSIQVLNAQGQLVLDRRYAAENGWLEMDLPEGLANGLYFLSVQPLSEARSVVRFVLER